MTIAKFGTRWPLTLLVVVLSSGAPASAQTFNADGATHNTTQQSGWALPAKSGSTIDYNNCLRCHQPGGTGSDRTSYLFGGHKNMSRMADGTKWGMPGVDATHPASPGLSGASLNADGSFSSLWIQEDAAKMAVDWLHGVSSAPSLATVGYCAKDGTARGRHGRRAGSRRLPDVRVSGQRQRRLSPRLPGRLYLLLGGDAHRQAVHVDGAGQPARLLDLRRCGAGRRTGRLPAREPALHVRPLPHDRMDVEPGDRLRHHDPEQAALHRLPRRQSRRRDGARQHVEPARAGLRRPGLRDSLRRRGGSGHPHGERRALSDEHSALGLVQRRRRRRCRGPRGDGGRPLRVLHGGERRRGHAGQRVHERSVRLHRRDLFAFVVGPVGHPVLEVPHRSAGRQARQERGRSTSRRAGTPWPSAWAVTGRRATRRRAPCRAETASPATTVSCSRTRTGSSSPTDSRRTGRSTSS